MDRYVIAGEREYALMEAFLAERRRWMVDLFSPAGLRGLFPGLR